LRKADGIEFAEEISRLILTLRLLATGLFELFGNIRKSDILERVRGTLIVLSMVPAHMFLVMKKVVYFMKN